MNVGDEILLGPVPSDLRSVVAIALGRSNAQAILSDGSIVQWGTIYDANLNPQPIDLHDFTAVANGGDHVLALRSNGEVVGWGSDNQRQASVPSDLRGVAAIAAGYTHSLALVDDGAPRFVQQPGDVAGLVGGDARLVANAFGATPLQYQWRQNGRDLFGATNAVLALDNLSFFDEGNYDVVVSNKHRSVISQSASVTVARSAPFNVVAQVEPATGAALLGGSALLSAHAEGTGPFAYRWFRDEEALIDSRGPTLQIDPVELIDAGNYWVVAANAFGSSTSAPVRISVVQVAVWGANFDRQLDVPPSATNLVAVYAGMFHTVGLCDDGTVVVWGNRPIDGGMHPGGALQPPVGLSNVVAVAAGGGFNLALKSDGRVVGWGDNSWGQLSGISQWSNIVAVAADYAHTLALRSDGSVLARGGNFAGQIDVPLDLDDGVAIAAGWESSTVLRSDGSLEQWGTGQKVPDDGSNDVAAIAPGLGLRKDGSLVGWPDTVPPDSLPIAAFSGSRDRQLVLRADGTVLPDGPAGLRNVIGIAAGFQHSVALISGGPPRLLQQPLGFTAASGRNARFAVSASGTQPMTYQWRQNGQSLPGATNQVLALDHVSFFDAGEYDAIVSNALGSSTSRVAVLELTFETPSALAIHVEPADGIAYLGGSALLTATAKGSPPFGYQWLFQSDSVLSRRGPTLQLDHLTFANSGEYSVAAANPFGSSTSAPVRLSVVNVAVWGARNGGSDARVFAVPAATTNAVALSASQFHALALRADGGTIAWGDPAAGQLNVPTGVSDLITVAAGGTFSLGLRKDGSVLVWGDSGGESYGLKHLPEGLTNVVQIAAAYSWALALRSDGTVLQWGTYIGGSMQPPPPGLANVARISAGTRHALALLQDGTVAGWGSEDPNQATARSGLSNIIAIAAGDTYSMALRDDGTVLEWGHNLMAPPLEATNLVAIATGNSHRVGLRDDGTVVSWGFENGGLGQTRVPADLPPVIAITAAGDASFGLIPTSGEPHLAKQPRTQALFTGQRLQLEASVFPGAAPVAYRWFKDGAELARATNRFFEVPAAALTNAGSYAVQVSNAQGQDISRTVRVTVSAQQPILLSQPNHVVTHPGGPVSFAARAIGSEPLAYQWFYNGAQLPSATNLVLALEEARVFHAGQYHVEVSNALGVARSRPAELKLAPAIFFTQREFAVTSAGHLRFQLRLSGLEPREIRARREYDVGGFRSGGTRQVLVVIPPGSVRQCAEIDDPALASVLAEGGSTTLRLTGSDSAIVTAPAEAGLHLDDRESDGLICDTVAAAPSQFLPGGLVRRADGGVEISFSAEGRFTVEASDDLRFWWAVNGVYTTDPVAPHVWFIDRDAGQTSMRFYRIRTE